MAPRRIPLDGDLVRRLIRARYGSIDEFEAAWEGQLGASRKASGRSRSRSTIYRWIDEGFPTTKGDYLAFTGTLDVDPFALLRLERDAFQAHFASERRFLQLGSPAASLLAPVWPILQPGPHWPNQSVASRCYGRPWTVFEFAHPALDGGGYYAGVVLTDEGRSAPAAPIAYHFAYRRKGALDGMWRPYGAVVDFGGRAVLVSESGGFVEAVRPEGADGAVVVETWFGPGPAEFRVASLHAFRGTLDDGAGRTPRLRFEA